RRAGGRPRRGRDPSEQRRLAALLRPAWIRDHPDAVRTAPARMRIGSVDPAERVAIVAELGNNHEGDVAVARELVHAAADAGAHAVKLQYMDPVGVVRRTETAREAQLAGYLLAPDEVAQLREL